jgi:hypothetical protein
LLFSPETISSGKKLHLNLNTHLILFQRPSALNIPMQNSHNLSVVIAHITWLSRRKETFNAAHL